MNQKIESLNCYFIFLFSLTMVALPANGQFSDANLIAPPGHEAYELLSADIDDDGDEDIIATVCDFDDSDAILWIENEELQVLQIPGF